MSGYKTKAGFPIGVGNDKGRGILAIDCQRALARRKFCNVGKKKFVLRQAQHERCWLRCQFERRRVGRIVISYYECVREYGR